MGVGTSGPKKVYRYRLIQKLIISLAATGGLSGSSPRPNRIAKGFALGLAGFTLQSLAGLRLGWSKRAKKGISNNRMANIVSLSFSG